MHPWPGEQNYSKRKVLITSLSEIRALPRKARECKVWRWRGFWDFWVGRLWLYVWLCFFVELRVSGCYGAFLACPDSRCVAMAALDWRTALAFEFTHSKSLDETRGVAIQVRNQNEMFTIVCCFTNSWIVLWNGWFCLINMWNHILETFPTSRLICRIVSDYQIE